MNARQERFVAEYLVDLNATQAAIRAGYSAKTANEKGSQLLAVVSVREAVNKGLAKRAEKIELTQDKVIRGLLAEAESGDKSSARVAAWSWLGRSLAMFVDRQQVEIDSPDRIEIVRRKA